jgi:hypothetical protein
VENVGITNGDTSEFAQVERSLFPSFPISHPSFASSLRSWAKHLALNNSRCDGRSEVIEDGDDGGMQLGEGKRVMAKPWHEAARVVTVGGEGGLQTRYECEERGGG